MASRVDIQFDPISGIYSATIRTPGGLPLAYMSANTLNKLNKMIALYNSKQRRG
jgi:hypothetical protein